MRRQETVYALVLFTCLALSHNVWARGTVVVSNDEWQFSQFGFSQAPDAATFARNIADWFVQSTNIAKGTNLTHGEFLVYSTNFGLRKDPPNASPLCSTLEAAGHVCEWNTVMSFDHTMLQGYQGVFLAGKPLPVDNTELIKYVENGGNVYLAGGTGFPPGEFADASEEAAAWKTFLNHFGLAFEDSAYNGVEGVIRITSSHPIFANVGSLYQNNGNDILDLEPTDMCEVLEDGLYAVCAATPLLPANHITNNRFALMAKGVDNRGSACEYYKAIRAVGENADCNQDDLDSPINFSEWKTRNGLAVDPLACNPSTSPLASGEVCAFYLNAVDLNLGRAMHGISNKVAGQDPRDLKVAYYVCNYATLEQTISNTNLKACVAMDYSAVAPDVNNGDPFIKFYVFDNGGNLITAADLDFQGPKFVPGLCVSCHGAHKDDPPEFYYSPFPRGGADVTQPLGRSSLANINAHFLPFDLDNFEFLQMPGLTRPDQEDDFKRLNEFILHTNDMPTPTTPPFAPVPPAVTELIQNWYTGGRPDQNRAFIPPGWSAKTPGVPPTAEALYSSVVKPSCRTCHSVMYESINWNTFGKFFGLRTSIKNTVCGTPPAQDPYMPNAEVTLNRFWLSEDLPEEEQRQPSILRNFLQITPSQCPEPAP
jgi:hypothetical protein